MFSNPRKFFKKNILLIGIVLLLIITAVYLLYINSKEGFQGPEPVKAKLVSVSTIEEFYNKYQDAFSYLCSFKISLILSNYKLAHTILVLKFISKIKYKWK